MSVALLLRDSARITAFAVCLLALPMVAQQVASQDGSATQAYSATAQNGTQAQGDTPNAPQPKNTSLNLPDYSKGKSHFPNPIDPYRPAIPPPAVLVNQTNLEQMIQNGKIMLSMNDAIALALTDNLDIAIARYNLPIADTDLLRTKAGATFFGAPSGLSTGTPGGGGIAATAVGGGTAGSAGVGAGASGVVQSSLGAGPNLDPRDPTIVGSLNFEHAIFPSSNTFITGGAAATVQNRTDANFTYTQGFAPGTLLTVTYDNSRLANKFLTLSPQLSSNFRMQIRQHLLQGFGLPPNQRFFRIPKNDGVWLKECS